MEASGAARIGSDRTGAGLGIAGSARVHILLLEDKSGRAGDTHLRSRWEAKDAIPTGLAVVEYPFGQKDGFRGMMNSLIVGSIIRKGITQGLPIINRAAQEGTSQVPIHVGDNQRGRVATSSMGITGCNIGASSQTGGGGTKPSFKHGTRRRLADSTTQG